MDHRGVLTDTILTVPKLPLCVVCIFATAHRRSWRTKLKSNYPNSKPQHNAPGRGTLCDHVVYHQPGLVSQSTGIHTHKKFWGSVLYANHYSDFIYNNLITGTISLATLESKQAYKRVAASYGLSLKSYHADNLRFNKQKLQGRFYQGQTNADKLQCWCTSPKYNSRDQN